MPPPPPIVILDRDGVINHDSPDFIRHADQWHPIAGSLASIARLNRAGYRVALATNQSGIARGYIRLEQLQAIHAKLRDQLAQQGGALDHIALCPHGPQDQCDCRKPKPGLIDQILQLFAPDQAQSPQQLNLWLVGDSLRDLQAGQQRHCKTLLVKTGNGQQTLTQHAQALAQIKPKAIVDDLAAAVDYILYHSVDCDPGSRDSGTDDMNRNV